MEGRVDLGYMVMHWPGVELAIFQSTILETAKLADSRIKSNPVYTIVHTVMARKQAYYNIDI